MSNIELKQGVLSGEENRFVKNIDRNVETNLIEITEDKLEIILLRHLDKLKLKKEWLIPLGIIISIITTLCTTTNFKKFLGFEGYIWKTIFVLVLFCMICWKLIILYKLYKYKGQLSVEYLIKKIRNVVSDEVKRNEDISAQSKKYKNEAIRENNSQEMRNEEERKDIQMSIFHIIKAEYGKNKKYVDVTNILKQRIVNNGLKIQVENKYFSDPIFNVKKELRVKYVSNGEVKAKVVPEHEVLILP